MKQSILALSIVSVFSTSPFVLAQQDTQPFAGPAQTMSHPEFEQHGDLVKIKFVPGDRETKIYVVGLDAAAVKVDDLTVTAHLKVGETEKVIKFKRKKDYFSTEEELKGEFHVQLHNQDAKKVDEFRIRLQNP